MKLTTDEEFVDGLEAWLMKNVGKTWWFNFKSSDNKAGNMALSISLHVWGLKSDEGLDYDGELVSRRGGA